MNVMNMFIINSLGPNSTYLINSELWTVPYNDMTMTWTITPLVSLNCSAAAAAAIASGREFQLLRRRRYCCVSLLYCHYQGYCLSNYPQMLQYNNGGDRVDKLSTVI